MSDEVLVAIRRLEDKVDANTVSQATLTERVSQTLKRVDDHVVVDAEFHSETDRRLDKLEGWRTRIMAYAAALAVVATFIVGLAKDAIASVFTNVGS